MDIAEKGPVQINPETNPIVGSSLIENLIEVDQGQWLNELRSEIKKANPQTEQEKISLASKLVKSKLKDAITAQTSPQYAKDKAAIDLATQDQTARLSSIIEGGYGVCRHFNTLALVALQEMGIQAALYGNPKYRHTFLYVNDDDKWRVDDPFAEVFFQNREGKPRLFPRDCYIGGDVVYFAKTSSTKELPNLNNPPKTESAQKQSFLTSFEQLKKMAEGVKNKR